MKFIDKSLEFSPIYDFYTKKHIYYLPNIGNKLEYSFCYKLNNHERQKLYKKIPGIYILGLNFTSSNLNPFFSPVYIGSSVDIRDRLWDYTNILLGKGRGLRVYERALGLISQEFWTFVWATCPDYEEIERNLIQTLCKLNGVYLFNNKYTGSYSTAKISFDKWKRYYIDHLISTFI